MAISISQGVAQGPRPNQEDRAVVITNSRGATLIGIFDGHGGVQAAELASQQLSELFIQGGNYYDRAEEILAYIYSKLDNATAELVCGTTASIVYIDPEQTKATVAILGDSPVIIYNGEKQVTVSPEHNVRSNPSELAAAVERGGVLYNGYLYDSEHPVAGLQMSRALGDKMLRRVTSRHPEIYNVRLMKGAWVLAASDGLLDPAHVRNNKTEIEAIAEMILGGSTAQDLVDAVLPAAHDNVTAVVARV